MDREQLAAEIKKQIRLELETQIQNAKSAIPEEVVQKATSTKKQLENEIKKNPLLAVLIAALLGFLLAKIFANKRD